MRTLILILVTLAYPSLSQAQVGYRWQCDGNRCVKVPITQAPAVVMLAPPVVAATPATYRTFEPQPAVVSFASYSAPAIPSIPDQWNIDTANGRTPWLTDTTGRTLAQYQTAPQIVSVGQPVVTSSTCNCSVTGQCVCDPATCACASCVNGAARMGLTPAVQYAAGNSYYSVSNPTVAERIINTPTGHVHVFTDQMSGIVTTVHSGGHQQRKVARQERWRAARGIQ